MRQSIMWFGTSALFASIGYVMLKQGEPISPGGAVAIAASGAAAIQSVLAFTEEKIRAGQKE